MLLTAVNISFSVIGLFISIFICWGLLLSGGSESSWCKLFLVSFSIFAFLKWSNKSNNGEAVSVGCSQS